MIYYRPIANIKDYLIIGSVCDKMNYYSDLLVTSTNFMKVYGSRKLFFLVAAMLLCGSV